MGEVKCELHDIQFQEHLKKDEENNLHIRETLHKINNTLQSLANVTIKNGGGRMVTFKREEYEQMLYDKMKWKWRDTIKDITIVVSVLTAVASLAKAFIL